MSATTDHELAKAHLLPHYTKGAAWRQETPIMVSGRGCYVKDDEGNEYLDGLAGLFCSNIGHGRLDLAAAAGKQAEKLAFFPNWGFATPPTIEAAALIAELAPGDDLSEVFFVSSGSEAVESAVKFARNYHVSRGDESRYKVIARDWAYHGTTLGALSVTGIPKFRKQFLPMLWDGVRHVPNTLDGASAEGVPVEDWPCVTVLEQTIIDEGPETVAMVIAEPVQNGRGALVPPDGYWQELRRICDKYGILLCADEVISGFGRMGSWFASERFDIQPDMITFAKGVTSAYQPLGGVVIKRSLVEQTWDSDLAMFNHGSTFGGHPVACAVAVANITALRDEGVLDNVNNNEAYFQEHLTKLVDRFDILKEWRGCGYFYAVEFVESREAGIELSEEDRAALQGGVLGSFVRDSKLLIRPDDRGCTMLVLSPPLIADRDVLDDLMERLFQICERTEAWLREDR
ncbi:MAG: aminotransferase class III-fold pyridoxal phosphate-dependent enzyme [Acidimicrobiia bacterium]|nr:aminotransferase class III-fold pyridoxal phosphate-dependent enzyme [Acidimicrobiia bacterium]